MKRAGWGGRLGGIVGKSVGVGWVECGMRAGPPLSGVAAAWCDERKRQCFLGIRGSREGKLSNPLFLARKCGRVCSVIFAMRCRDSWVGDAVLPVRVGLGKLQEIGRRSLTFGQLA